VPRQTHKVHVFVTDSAKEAMDILNLQHLVVADVILIVKDGGNAGNSLALVLGRLDRSAAVLRLLAALGDGRAGRQHFPPPSLPLSVQNRGMEGLVNLEFAAPNTRTAQDIHDPGHKVDGIDGPRQAIEAEMTRTAVIRLTARPTNLAILENAHAGVKQAPALWLISFKGGLGCNFDDRPLLNLFG